MKHLNNLLFVGLGVASTIMYQKYHQTACEKIEEMLNRTIKTIDIELEEMM